MKYFPVTALILLHSALSQIIPPSGLDDLSITISTAGDYAIKVLNDTWLHNAPTFFRADGNTYSTKNHTLKLTASISSAGSDMFGHWQTLVFHYVAGTMQIEASIKTYDNLPLIIFSQKYVNGTEGTATDTNDVISGFPGFFTSTENVNLGYLSYGGSMFGDSQKVVWRWNDKTKRIRDGLAGGPLAIFDDKGRTIIVAAYSHFMAASSKYDSTSGTMHWGIMGGVEEVPQSYQYDTVLYYGRGINQAFNEWGTIMRLWNGRDDIYRRDDLTVNYLGYWTDNGAFYYYNTEKGKNYEQTIIDVSDYIKSKQIPFKYLQFDSWWYYKGHDGGDKTWAPREDIFPNGFLYVHYKTGLPMAAHNRWWASDTTYATQNGGNFTFIISGKAVPVDLNFWSYLFGVAKTWGLIMYEQDWLYNEFVGVETMLHNISLGDIWLSQMHTEAVANGLTIQYCMSYPRHAMSTLKHSAVTQARVSEDYHPGMNQWKIGISSMFAWAMGIAPFKDTFWTTTVQLDNPYGKSVMEPNTILNTIVSTLSTGPVGPSDKIGAVNKTILMRCCRIDGYILKPSKPATAIDLQYLKMTSLDMSGPDGEVWTTYSDILDKNNKIVKYGTVLAADMQSLFKLYPKDTGIYNTPTLQPDRLFIYRNGDTMFQNFSNGEPILIDKSCSKSDPCLYHISPQLENRPEGTFLLGQLDKWVPISPQRVQYVIVDDTKTSVVFRGVPDETFKFWFSYNYKVSNVKCVINTSGRATFVMETRTCG